MWGPGGGGGRDGLRQLGSFSFWTDPHWFGNSHQDAISDHGLFSPTKLCICVTQSRSSTATEKGGQFVSSADQNVSMEPALWVSFNLDLPYDIACYGGKMTNADSVCNTVF